MPQRIIDHIIFTFHITTREITALTSANPEPFGYSLSELQQPGTLFTDLIADSDLEALHDFIESLEDSEQEASTSLHVTFADGTTRLAGLYAFAIPDKEDIVIRGLLIDLSKRTQTPAELEVTYLRLRILFENLQSGVMVEDENRQISFVNDQFRQLFNIEIDSDALIGADCSQMARQASHFFEPSEQFVKDIEQIIADKRRVTNQELRMVDGRYLERDYIPIFAGENYIGHLWQYRDVTEKVQARKRQERLLEMEKLNRSLSTLFLVSEEPDQAIDEALALVGQALDVSRAYVFHFQENERLLDNTHEWCAPGIKPEITNLQGLPFDEMIPSFFPKLREQGMIAATHISELEDDLRMVLEPQGIQSILHMPFFVHERMQGFIGFDENRRAREWLPEEIAPLHTLTESYGRILERKQAEKQLTEARDAALRSARLKSEFMSNMSHEIRTPMTGVIGMLELLQETSLDEEQREFSDIALTSARSLLNILNDILDFSRIEAGRMVLEDRPTRLSGILTEVKMTLLTQARENRNEITVEIDESVPERVLVDATRLRQVLMNLVSNAIKFTHNGYIQVQLHHLSTANERTRLRFAVRDTGIGISAGQIERIFDSFIQADGSTTRKYGGTGLGLAISKQLIQLMGGELKVESNQGEGSLFAFELSLPVVASKKVTREIVPRLSRMRVLIIDEDATARYVLAQQLRIWKVQVIEADSPYMLPVILQQSVAEEKPIDIVLLHSQLPVAEQEKLVASVQSMPEVECRLLVRLDDKEVPFHSDRSVFDARLIRPPLQSQLYDMLLQLDNPPIENVEADLSSVTDESDMVKKGRVMLVEDNPITWRLVRHALYADYHVIVAGNGQKALDTLAEMPCDLILMDMHMPVMDGRETVKRIRSLADSSLREVPIIALTASVLSHEQDEYFDLGVNAVLGKPFAVDDLRQIVQKWISGNV